MRAIRLATVAVFLAFISVQSTTVSAQILDTGEGRCGLCGHSEHDTQRYVNSFLNQMFFPHNGSVRVFVAANLYLLSGTFTMHGNKSPDPNFDRVTIAITAEVKSALPTGNYRVTVTTPGGQTSTKLYAIGDTRFVVTGNLNFREETSSGGGAGGGRAAPPTSGGTAVRGGSRGPAKCSQSRREDRRYETILWCSAL
jgi:hypothetical protein